MYKGTLNQNLHDTSINIRPKKIYIYVFQVSALKKTKYDGNCYFSLHFPPVFIIFDNILLTINNKMFKVGAKT